MALAAHFERIKRPNGKWSYTLKDTAPEWLRDAVYSAHTDRPPNDWIYEECYDACVAIDDDSLSDCGEYADQKVEPYTRELFEWAAEFCLSSLFAESEETVNGYRKHGDTVSTRLIAIQREAITFIASTILTAWENNQSE